MIKKWENIPDNLKNDDVRKYYEILHKKRHSLFLKRIFDLVIAGIIIIVFFPVFILIGILIKIESNGPVIFKQTRITQYGKHFSIYKFRTMAYNTDISGSLLTTKNDKRVTKTGKILRKFRLDETPQIVNILTGDMTFVGTRPEVEEYVKIYSDEMLATLLLPAGLTSEASIYYKDEEKLLENAKDADNIYINKVLPEKMKFNLKQIETFSFSGDFKTMLMTIINVIKKDKI